MADMLSPGVYLEEVDASQIVSAASSNVACFAGNFKKGSVGEYNTVNSVADLIDISGILITPTITIGTSAITFCSTETNF